MATSRRSGQRRDVTERTYANVATFGETSRRSGKRRDVGGNVPTFQKLLTINVATLVAHVATFQRWSKSTSRRWNLTSRRFRGCKKSTSQHWKATSRRSRGTQNQRRDVGISHRDIPEKVKIDIATLNRRDVETQRRDVT